MAERLSRPSKETTNNAPAIPEEGLDDFRWNIRGWR
jgi:hypothetical protein